MNPVSKKVTKSKVREIFKRYQVSLSLAFVLSVCDYHCNLTLDLHSDGLNEARTRRYPPEYERTRPHRIGNAVGKHLVGHIPAPQSSGQHTVSIRQAYGQRASA